MIKNQAIDILRKNNTVILEAWMKLQLLETGLSDTLITHDDLRAQSDELLNGFVEVISDDTIDKPGSAAFDPIHDILAAISMSRAQLGYSPRETGGFVLSLKQVVNEALVRGISDPYELNQQTQKINKIIDSFSVATFEAFIKGREEVILRQVNEIADISTPVIQVWDGIVALPIIGTLDSARAQTVMENLLQKVVDTGSSIAILDITGVPAVDSLVAQHLMKTVSAMRLMGGECIISGIRPEIAQAIVHLGIDLSTIITKASMGRALKTAFAMKNLRVDRSRSNQ